MNKKIKIWICLYRSQWHGLKPHVPDIVHVIPPDPPLLVFDCICCNMTVYRKILAAAKKSTIRRSFLILEPREKGVSKKSPGTRLALYLRFSVVLHAI
jgi:hypothetical protein